jgi:hypothetical protein
LGELEIFGGEDVASIGEFNAEPAVLKGVDRR